MADTHQDHGATPQLRIGQRVAYVVSGAWLTGMVTQTSLTPQGWEYTLRDEQNGLYRMLRYAQVFELADSPNATSGISR